jgi:hypothetical protein
MKWKKEDRQTENVLYYHKSIFLSKSRWKTVLSHTNYSDWKGSRIKHNDQMII